MSNYTGDDIVEMARRRITERDEQVSEARGKREVSWRYAFLGLLGALLLALLFWPGLPLEQKLYAVGHGICAQEHAVSLAGLRLPICARNTGIYASFLITGVYLLALGRSRAARIPPMPISVVLVLFVIVMAVDGFNSLFNDLLLPHLYPPRNELRTLTGIGMGVSIAVIVFLMLNNSIWRDSDTRQPILKSWWELGGALLLCSLILVGLYGNIGLMYWPIAIVSSVGILGVLYCVNLLIVSMATGYENSVTRVAQLARPATLALLVTLFEVSALSGLRYWLERTGLMA
ncbi:MAG TPA: DUF2085 domain-containing protein [Roseiflexaceae bacterium]|nr:DUF2085 domain-containing protein [Roseiflexaceae bacterium]